MKTLKFLALAAAAAAVTAFIGTGTASASVLCSTTSTPCTGKYGATTKFDATLEETALLESTGGVEEKTCTLGRIKGRITNAGGATATVTVGLEEWIWNLCTKTTTMIAAGELEIHHLAGADDATITGKNTKWTTNILQNVSCTYGFGSGVDVGTLRGGPEPTIEVDAVLTKQEGGFFCPATQVLKADFEFTEPKPLYVEAE